MTVCNLKGWGLRMNKIWSDADYMSNREETYFAVFTKDENGALTLVPNTVRKLNYNDNPQSLYWYFQKLPVSGVNLENYVIREVTVSETNPAVDNDGYVTNYGVLTVIEEGGK